jgi:preprotein translocase SecE subunit
LPVGTVDSRHLLPARFSDLRRGHEFPRTIELVLRLNLPNEGWAEIGCSGFPEIRQRLTTALGSRLMAFSPFKFLQEVRSEDGKVTWPTRREVTITTIMVFVMVALASIFFFLADQAIRYLVTLVLGIH